MSIRWLSLSVLVLFAAACAPRPQPCGPATCSGCCSAAGDCQTSGSALACGLKGSSCQQCTGAAVCVAGACASGSGGSGGGSTAGGNPGGGSTAGGNPGGGNAAGGSAGSGVDAGRPDASTPDAGSVDAGRVDAGLVRDGGCTLAFGPLQTHAGAGSYLTTSDFDRDGRPDLAWTNPFQDELGVLLNSDAGLRSVAITRFGARAWPGSVAVADIDLDGFDDLVIGAFFSSQLVVARNDQQGRFSLTTRYQVPNVWWVSAAPLDTVPGLDLVVSNELREILVLRNMSGALALPNPWATDAGHSTYGNCVGDFRRMGVNDVVALSGLGEGAVTVLRNDGTARFTVSDHFTIVGRPMACVVGDLDADGLVDLVVTTLDSTVELFRGTSAGRLQPFATLSGLKSETAPALADLDLDGRPELVISSTASDGGVYVVRALEDGGVGLPARVPGAPGSVAAVVIADFDGDGLDDVAGVGAGQTFVVPNRCR